MDKWRPKCGLSIQGAVVRPEEEGNSDTCYSMMDLKDVMLSELSVTKGQILYGST